MNRKDFASGFIAESIGTDGSVLTFVTGYGQTMPAVPFYLTATPPGQLTTLGNSEKLLVTAKLTDETFTITRARGDTIAKDIRAGWVVSNAVYVADIIPPVTSVNGKTGAVVINKTDIGLSNVPNLDTTAAVANQHTHANKAILDSITAPYTTDEQTKLAGISSGATSNSSDAFLLSRTNHTGVQSISTVTGLQTALDSKEAVITAGTTGQYWRGDKSWQTLNKATIGLSNVDNTADTAKPISTATQTALNAKQDTLMNTINIKSINGTSLLGSGDVVIATGGGTWGSISGTLSDQVDLQVALDDKFNIVGGLITGPVYFQSNVSMSGGDLNMQLNSVVDAFNFTGSGQLQIPRVRTDYLESGTGGSFINVSSSISMGGWSLTDLIDPTMPLDAVNKQFLDSAVAAIPIGNYVLKAGDTMTGRLSSTFSTGLGYTQSRGGVERLWGTDPNGGFSLFNNTGTAYHFTSNNTGTSLYNSATINVPTHTLTLPSTATGIALYTTTDQTTNYGRLTMAIEGGDTFRINALYSTASVAAGSRPRISLRSQNAVTSETAEYLNQRKALPFHTFSVGATVAGTGNFYQFSADAMGATSGNQTLIALTPTINQSGTAGYTAILANVGETSTGSGAKNLIDLQVGGVSLLRIPNTGDIVMPGTGTGIISDSSAGITRMFGGNTITNGAGIVMGGSTNGAIPDQGELRVGSNGMARWNATGLTLSALAGLQNATHTLTLASSATGIALYNTTDQTTNYERLMIDWSGNNARIYPTSAGTGSMRNLSLGAFNRVVINATDSSSNGYIQIGSTASSGGIRTIKSTTALVNSSGIAYGVGIENPINQSGTAGYTALLINPTETSTGSGAKLLADFQVGGVTKFSVGNSGNLFTNGFIGAGVTPGGAVINIAASSTTYASMRIRPGLTPTSPSDGDVWYDGTDLKMRMGGVTKTFTLL